MNNTKKIKFQAVLFDFDYTLADTSRGAMESINFALNSLHLPSASYDAICQTIGMSLAETYHTLSGNKQSLQTDKFIHFFKERADRVMEKLSVLYDPVPSVVKDLKKNGLLLGIVSTKFHYRIEAILKRNKLLDKFDVIIGGEDVSKQKPDPEGLQLAINTLSVPPSNVLYVGDSIIDAETAEKANVPFAAVLSGVTKRNEFDKYIVYSVHKDLYELLNWLK